MFDFQLHNYLLSRLKKKEKAPEAALSAFTEIPVYETLRLLAEGAGIPAYPVEQLIKYHGEKYSQRTLRYWAVADLHLHSKLERFYLFDVEAKTVTKYHVAHGKNSDKDFDGLLEKWSNEHGSLCSSKGMYLCAEHYTSVKFGYALRLDGLDVTNSNVRGRGVVLHGAKYADDDYIKDNKKCGRSEGCLAFDFSYSSGLVDKLKNGSLIYVWDGVTPIDPPKEESAPVVGTSRFKADWDGKPFADNWTATLSLALEMHGKDLLNLTSIKDSAKWCPRFALLNRWDKKQFFIMLISSMARQESGFDPKQSYTESFKDAKGKRVISRGLLQISQESANSSKYKGNIKTESQLHDVETNLIVGVKILNYWIPKDQYIGSSNVSGIKNAGGGRYWSVMRDSSRSHKIIVDKMKALKFT